MSTRCHGREGACLGEWQLWATAGKRAGAFEQPPPFVLVHVKGLEVLNSSAAVLVAMRMAAARGRRAWGRDVRTVIGQLLMEMWAASGCIGGGGIGLEDMRVHLASSVVLLARARARSINCLVYLAARTAGADTRI